MEDTAITELFWQRNESANGELIAKYGALARSVAGNILGSDEDAEECLNDTVFAVWNSIPPNRPHSMKAYVCALARNRALSRLRKNCAKKRGGAALYEIYDEIDETAGRDGTIEAFDEHELKRMINVFLGGLKPSDRTLFVRRYFFADDLAALSRKSGKSANAVAVRLARLRNNLREQLSKGGVTL